MSLPNRVDVHHHFIPPKFAEALEKVKVSEWIVPSWSLSSSRSLMQKVGTSVAILSLTSPGCDIVSRASEQLALAQDANDTGAAARDAEPSQFGFFATIPNPNKYPDEALAELSRALDDLHADGVCLLTSYDGKYLGDKAFAPLWSEINKRKAVVFIHPTSPPSPYKPVNETLLPPIMDFTFETTKAACDLITSNVITQCPEVKIILSHGGGTFPYIWHRVAQLPKHMKMTDLSFEQFQDQASSFYFDTALTGYGPSLELLLEFAKPGHVLYGRDFPYAPDPCIEEMTQGLDEFLDGKSEEAREQVAFGNASALFHRLRSYHAQ